MLDSAFAVLFKVLYSAPREQGTPLCKFPKSLYNRECQSVTLGLANQPWAQTPTRSAHAATLKLQPPRHTNTVQRKP